MEDWTNSIQSDPLQVPGAFGNWLRQRWGQVPPTQWDGPYDPAGVSGRSTNDRMNLLPGAPASNDPYQRHGVQSYDGVYRPPNAAQSESIDRWPLGVNPNYGSLWNDPDYGFTDPERRRLRHQLDETQ